jgi:succinyl-diaminopimelate desuccinylase
MTGGTAFNAVCGKCTVKPKFLPSEDELKKFNLIFSDGVIVSMGKSCHGSRPHLGVNAMKKMFEYMLYKGENVQNVLDYLFYDKAKVFNIQNEQGGVTLSPNIVSEKDNKIEILCDVRVPAPIKLQDLYPIFDGFNLEYSPEVHRDPLYVPKDSDFVQKLLKAYNNATGENAVPESMSGGTFAYVFQKGCAFGPEFKGLDTGIHEPNERVKKDDLLKMYAVYKSAIKELVK